MNGERLTDECIAEWMRTIGEELVSGEAGVHLHRDLARKVFKMARRCAELETERDALREMLAITNGGEVRYIFGEEADALTAHAARLKETGAEFAKYLKWIRTEFFPEEKHFKRQLDAFNEILSATPADSLREYRNGVIEEVISQCGKWVGEGQLLISAKEIRAMKEADNAG